jgi:hypothetical protein
MQVVYFWFWGRCGSYKTVRRYILNLLFTIIPLIFFTIASSIASLEKSEKLGNYLSLSLVFLHRNYFGSIDDGWRAAFPIHQDIIISTIPLESMKSESGSQITELLPMTFTNY